MLEYDTATRSNSAPMFLNCQSTKRKQHVVALFKVFSHKYHFFGAPRLTMYPWKKMELSFYVIFYLGMVECSSSIFFQKTCQSSTAGMHSVEKTCPKPPLNLPSWLHQIFICISSFRQDSKFSYRYSLSWSKEVWKSNLQQHGEMKCRKQERRVQKKENTGARSKW